MVSFYHPTAGEHTLAPGETLTLTYELGWSEVNMHMKVADKTLPVTIHAGADYWDSWAEVHTSGDANQAGPPITMGEAGLYNSESKGSRA